MMKQYFRVKLVHLTGITTDPFKNISYPDKYERENDGSVIYEDFLIAVSLKHQKDRHLKCSFSALKLKNWIRWSLELFLMTHSLL